MPFWARTLVIQGQDGYHLVLKKGSNLLEVFSNLNEMVQTAENIEGIDFAKDEN